MSRAKKLTGFAIIIPLFLGVLLTISTYFELEIVTEIIGILMTVLCPSWVILWLTMQDPDSTLLFIGLSSVAIALNVILYLFVGYLLSWIYGKIKST